MRKAKLNAESTDKCTNDEERVQQTCTHKKPTTTSSNEVYYLLVQWNLSLTAILTKKVILEEG